MPNRIDKVLEECSDFTSLLKSLPKSSLFVRGVNNDEFEIETIINTDKERVPRHVPLNIHNYLNEYHFQNFGWKIRNGIFTFGLNFSDKPDYNLGYGTDYIFFASNNFKYVFDERIFDLCCFILEHNVNEQNIDLLNNLYSNKNLEKAFDSLLEHDKRTVEIIFNCDHYYLISINYADELIAKIWK